MAAHLCWIALRRALLGSAAIVSFCFPNLGNADAPSLVSQNTETAEILLISTRGIGTKCDPVELNRGLDCRRLQLDAAGKAAWTSYDWHHLLEPQASARRTVIYVHGNRVAIGDDAIEGMAVYESLVSLPAGQRPLRYIIWSWPSSQIPGPIKDYQVKAVRTNPVAWQLAWFLDQLPSEMQLSLVGYSYGARAVSGTMHLLGGGTLDGLKLESRRHPQRTPARVAMMAAAFDADWLLPGEVHQRAISQMQHLVLVTNRLDPAMRFFKLSTRQSRVDALGLAGIPHSERLGKVQDRIDRIDVTAGGGRSHVLYDYLADEPKMKQMWQELLDATPPNSQSDPLPAYANLRPASLR